MAYSTFVFTCCCLWLSPVSGLMSRRNIGLDTISAGGDTAEDLLRPTFDDAHSLDFVLVVPKYRMLFCYIPKNACSQFNGLVNSLNGLAAPEGSPWFGSSALSYFGWSREELREALRSDSWYKATVLRDPLERTLSAYLSKCRPGEDGTVEDGGQHCLGWRDEVRNGQPPAYPEFLERLRKLEQTPEGLTDAHFRPQVDFCGGLNMSDYDFVGSLDGNVNRQAKALLTAVGASGDLALADQFFPPDGQKRTTGQNSLTSASSPRIFKQYYKTSDDFVHAYRTYHRDYSHFPILRQRQKANKICITCLFSLDFEKRRVLDWIAYHDLMGVDCFLLFVDRNRTDVHDAVGADVYQNLLDAPQVTLLDAEQEGDRIPPPAIMTDLSALLGIRYLMTLDGDEFAVLEGDTASDAVVIADASHQILEASARGDASLSAEEEAEEENDEEGATSPDAAMDPEALAAGVRASLDEAALFLIADEANEGVASFTNAAGATSAFVDVEQRNQPPSLRSYLDEVVGQQGALGVYMHRWDYGTSGFVQPPPLLDQPEFAVLFERRGDAERTRPVARAGKVILNLPTGVEFVGVHTWTVPEDGGSMLLPNGTTFHCTPECMCGDLCKGVDHKMLRQDGPDECDAICVPVTPQRLFVNHYKTGSLQECYARKANSVWGRRTEDECNMMHPGTPQYLEAEAASGFVNDPVLAKYAFAVRERREELFPSDFAI